MKQLIIKAKEMKSFLGLWSTQSFSALGSLMTSYALVIWSYGELGSALATAMLMVCTYAPYVILSIFAGALSDKWNKKATMLVCDCVAAACTVAVLILLKSGALQLWHVYLVNAVNGFMNTVQQPASEVAITRILPEKYYQKVGGLRYFSNSLNTIFQPIIATALMGLFGIEFVIWFDLFTFAVAFLTLLFFIKIPEDDKAQEKKESLLKSAKAGLNYLKENRGILTLILFLACINLTASLYQSAVPPMMLSREGGSMNAYGVFQTVVGITTLIGSIIASALPAPKSRIRVICNCLLFSMSFENFALAFGRNIYIWCIGAFVGWIAIPLFSTNFEAVLRLKIPVELQGRVFAARNTLQFFTIPVGYFLGGLLVDKVFEPVMANQREGSLLANLFGIGKGSGAGFFFFVIAFTGIATCLIFRRSKALWALEAKDDKQAAE